MTPRQFRMEDCPHLLTMLASAAITRRVGGRLTRFTPWKCLDCGFRWTDEQRVTS